MMLYMPQKPTNAMTKLMQEPKLFPTEKMPSEPPEIIILDVKELTMKPAQISLKFKPILLKFNQTYKD